jgi:3-deoxy-manno-octulosonate cytidylyltransferase (CMP-KDO synthetase)
MVNAVAILPARYAASRLPGKPLLAETGTPLICHVMQQALKAKTLKAAMVATDDPRIFDAVTAAGYAAVMTRADHPNGTSRIAEVAAALPSSIDIIVNVQGDEPEIDPALIDAVVNRLADGNEPMATLAGPFAADEDPSNPNIVKVVVSQQGRALYFSRALIPFNRDNEKLPGAGVQPLKHAGLYAYRREFLDVYTNLSPTPAEQLEKLEQLRALEHGHPIAVVTAPFAHQGIDTPQQYAAFVARWRAAGKSS